MLTKEHRAVRSPLFIVCICCSIVRNKILDRLITPLMWYILKQLFTSVSVKVVDIYLAALQVGKYPPTIHLRASQSECGEGAIHLCGI